MLKYTISTHLDDPLTTLTHRDLIRCKPFLKKLYTEWYSQFKKECDNFSIKRVLEIGSGGGFLDEVMPGVTTSDILPLPHCTMAFSAEKIPFSDESLSAIVMLNVFHHIPKPYLFLSEAQRVLAQGGKIVMIEPANSIWGRFIYKNFHHEPFDEKGGWEVISTGPMSSSNQALPYIYFERDRTKFEKEFLHLKIEKLYYHTPLRYIVSGGVSRCAMVPSWSFGFFKAFDRFLSACTKQLCLFETVVLTKV